uniref:Cytokinin dehydrogenase 1 FAD/cytokinin binding domain-containing protein n=1 Tax=Aegilops tauschii subsp. strangulata TaxID=200361 RepID=A0A453CHC4_AEGTS
VRRRPCPAPVLRGDLHPEPHGRVRPRGAPRADPVLGPRLRRRRLRRALRDPPAGVLRRHRAPPGRAVVRAAAPESDRGRARRGALAPGPGAGARRHCGGDAFPATHRGGGGCAGGQSQRRGHRARVRGRGRRRPVGGGAGGVPEGRPGAAVLDGLLVPHRGRDAVQCRHQRPGVQAWPADQQRPAAPRNGEVVTCSRTKSPDLFFAVLGGLGQFGIITRARILLQEAPPKVRWVRAFYDSFETFTKDQELLISMPEQVDYVEGFMVLDEHSIRSSSIAFPARIDFSPDFGSEGRKKVYYCIEFAVHDFQPDGSSSSVDHVVELVAGRMSHMRSHMYSVEVSYFDFLNRVRMEEESLRRQGLWDVPHPWLNMFVPKHGIAQLKDLLM